MKFFKHIIGAALVALAASPVMADYELRLPVNKKAAEAQAPVPAAIEFVGAASVTSSGSISISLDTIPIQAGDIAIIAMSHEDGGSGFAYTGDLIPSNVVHNAQGGILGQYFAYHILNGSEATFGVQHGSFRAGVVLLSVFRNAQVADFSKIGPTSSNVTPNPPSLSGFSTGDWVVAAGMQDDDHVTYGIPAGYTEAVQAGITCCAYGSGRTSAVVAYKESDQAIEDPDAFSASLGDSMSAITFRLSPL